MPQIDIREVSNQQELAEMFDQRWLVLRSPLGMEKGSEKDSHEEGALHLIAACDDKIIGSARLRESSPGLGNISYVAVLPEFQNHVFVAEITFEKADDTYTYRSDLIKDETKTVRLKGSCGAKKESEFVKYSVENLHFYSKKEESMFVGYPSVSMPKLVESV